MHLKSGESSFSGGDLDLFVSHFSCMSALILVVHFGPAPLPGLRHWIRLVSLCQYPSFAFCSVLRSQFIAV